MAKRVLFLALSTIAAGAVAIGLNQLGNDPSAQWVFPLFVTSVIVFCALALSIAFALHLLGSRKAQEIRAGYTTSRGEFQEVAQVDHKSGVVIREAGCAFLPLAEEAAARRRARANGGANEQMQRGPVRFKETVVNKWSFFEFRRGLVWQVPWFIGGIILIAAAGVLPGLDVIIIWLPMLAGIPASSVAYIVSGANLGAAQGTARLGLLAVAAVPVAAAILVLVYVAPTNFASFLLALAVLCLAGSPLVYVCARMWKKG